MSNHKKILTELPSDDQTDPIVQHLGGVHPEVCVDNDHVPRMHVSLDKTRTGGSTLWWRLEVPSLGS